MCVCVHVPSISSISANIKCYMPLNGWRKIGFFFAVQFIRCGCCCCGCWSLALAAVIWSVCIFVFVHGFAPLKWAKTSTTTTTNDYFDHDVKYFCCFSFHSLACACVSNMNLLLLFVASILYDDFKSSEMRNVWNVLMSSKFFLSFLSFRLNFTSEAQYSEIIDCIKNGFLI